MIEKRNFFLPLHLTYQIPYWIGIYLFYLFIRILFFNHYLCSKRLAYYSYKNAKKIVLVTFFALK